MNAPHFRTDAALAVAFDARMARRAADPAGAVRLAHARGYRVEEADVPTPFLEQFAALPKAMQAQFQVAHSVELSNEKTARMLARGSASILAARGDAAAAKAAADREARIVARAAELEAEDLAARRAAWRVQAERAIDGPPAAEAKPKARRSA
jgi:hypothetical protein